MKKLQSVVNFTDQQIMLKYIICPSFKKHAIKYFFLFFLFFLFFYFFIFLFLFILFFFIFILFFFIFYFFFIFFFFFFFFFFLFSLTTPPPPSPSNMANSSLCGVCTRKLKVKFNTKKCSNCKFPIHIKCSRAKKKRIQCLKRLYMH